MAISSKRAPKAPTPEMQRIIQQIYDDINEVILSVNQKGNTSTSSGKVGDIRVNKTDEGEYSIEAHTKDGWAKTNLTLIEE